MGYQQKKHTRKSLPRSIVGLRYLLGTVTAWHVYSTKRKPELLFFFTVSFIPGLGAYDSK